MKVLSIVETAYRATLEEQDDTIVWLTHALKAAGADVSVLLRGNAVNYGLESQDASGLSFGAVQQTQPPDLVGDVSELMARGVPVYVVEEDIEDRGLERRELIDGLQPVPRAGIAALLGGFDQVWHW